MADKTFEQLTAISATEAADKLPIWDDSASVAAYITISDFQTDVLGTGFVKADGTVPMTGNLDLAGTETTSTDSNTAHLLGRAFIGTPSGLASDNAYFGHRDFQTIGGYMIRQGFTGNVLVNAPTGGAVSFCINNSTLITYTAANINFFSLPITSNDGDVAYTFGRSTLGYDGTTSDVAIFAHRDNATSTNFGFKQDADGNSYINSKTGENIYFQVNGSTKIFMDETGELGINNIDPQTKLHITDTALTLPGLAGDTKLLIEHDGTVTLGMISNASNNAQIAFGDTGNGASGLVGYEHANDRFVFNTTAISRFYIDDTELYPATDAVYDCGKSGNRFQDVWASNSTIQTSDLAEKQNIMPLLYGVDFINSLKPVSYEWLSTPERMERKKEHTRSQVNRKHYGLIAQQVKEAMDNLDISTDDFAGYVEYDTDNGVGYGLRYGEFIAPLIKAVQELSLEVSKLKSRIT